MILGKSSGISFLLIACFFVSLLLWTLPALGQEEDPEGDAKETDQGDEKAKTTEGEGDPGEEIELAAEEVEKSTPPKDMRSEDGLVSLDFNNTEINEIVKTMSEMTGRNFMIDKTVAGQVTIISPTKVTPQEAYDIFLSVLAVNGFTTVEVGKITKIIPRKDAKQNPIPTRTGGIPEPTDAIITQLIPLTNIDCNDIAQAFSNLIGPDGDLFAYGPSNMVIVSDAASNVNRLYRIIQQLDTEGAEQQIAVIPIEYANAEIIAEMIAQLFEEGMRKSSMGSVTQQFARGGMAGRAASASRIRGMAGRMTGGQSTNIPSQTIPNLIADVRTNSLIVKSSSFGIRRVRDIVTKLDQPLPGGEGKIHVVYLQNADSEEMAATLAELAGSGGGMGMRGGMGTQGSQRSLAGSRSSGLSGGLAGGMSGLGSSRYGSQFGGQFGSQFGSGAGGAYGRQQTGRSSLTQTTGRLFADFDGAVRITADPPTNSLVIVASNRDYLIIKEVISKLDIPRRQVFVEAVILEITMDSGLDLGFEFRSTNDSSEEGIQVIGGTNYGGITNAAANPLGISGFAVGAVDGTITYAGTEFPNIGALFRAMQTDKNVNVLSTPNLLTMDNEEAEIVVADNIPFITGQIFSANNSNPTTTIERKDVGITLRIIPQINESDFVRLEIYEESSSVTDSPEGLTAAEVGVTTSKRSASTLVVVKDRQTVIVGGLMKDNVSYAEAKIPVLGDIPVLGYLFKSSKKSSDKTNLLLFLTPYIIKDASDLEEVTRVSNERMRIFREHSRSTPKSDYEEFYLREQNLTPSEDTFKSKMQDVIETDPNLRKSGNEENSVQTYIIEDSTEEETPSTEGQTVTPPADTEVYEDFTEESDE